MIEDLELTFSQKVTKLAGKQLEKAPKKEIAIFTSA